MKYSPTEPPLKLAALAMAALVAIATIPAQAAAGESLPFSLSKDWKVFLNVADVDFYDSIPATLKTPQGEEVTGQPAALRDSSVDLAALAGKAFKERDLAILYNEFSSPREGVMRIGGSANYWMEIFINGKPIYNTTKWGGGNGSRAFIPDDHTFDLPVKEGSNLLVVKVWSGHDGWRFVCGSPARSLRFVANHEWKPVDMSGVLVKAGSALDLTKASAIPQEKSENPALPRLVVGPDGKLAAQGHPDQRVRLAGTSVPYTLRVTGDNWKAEVAELCQGARRQGYNFFRVFSLDRMSPTTDLSITPENLDKVDYLVSEAGKNGIYLYLIVTSYCYYLANPAAQVPIRDDIRARMYLGDPKLRKAWRYGAETILNRVNPYTGVALKDDPTVACVEFSNEQENGLMLLDRVSQKTREAFDARFQAWLLEKYKTLEALTEAWKDSSITSFEDIKVPKKLQGLGSGPQPDDFVLFCNTLARENADWFIKTIGEIGYKGLTAQYNLPYWLGDCEVRYEKSQVAIVNKYFNHPSAQSEPGSKVRQNSAVSDEARYWAAMNATRFADRPLFVTEFNHAFWNQYQHQGGLLFGAYSAFQGIDAIVVHESAVTAKVAGPNWAWSVGYNPVARANEFLSSCLFLRGDVKVSPNRVDLEIPEDLMGSMTAVSVDQSKIGLMSGFSVSFPWAPTPEGIGSASKADMVIAPAAGGEIQASGWSVDTVAAKDSQFSGDDFVTSMKAAGILPASNISRPSNGVFQSNTGEITLRARENLLKVTTEKTEGVSLNGAKGEELNRLNVINTTAPALVAACSVDDGNLEESKKIVLLYSTEIANSNMELSRDRVTLIKAGGLPVLMKTGKLSVSLRNKYGASMALYALGIDGTRREKLPMEFSDGVLKIDIDTANLENGPTPFFELVVQE